MKKVILIITVLFVVILASCGANRTGTQGGSSNPDGTKATTDIGTDSNIDTGDSNEETTEGTVSRAPSDTEPVELPERTELRLAIDLPHNNIMRKAKIISHNGYDSPIYPPLNLIDNKATTKWSARPTDRNDGKDSYWVVIELDKVHDFNTYTIMGAGNHGGDQAADVPTRNTRAWEVYISLDNKNWTLIDSVKDNVKSDLSVYVGQQKAKYVKLNVTHADQGSNPKNSILRIYEFQLYNFEKDYIAPLVPSKNDNTKVTPTGKYLPVGSQTYTSQIDVLYDDPFTIQVKTNAGSFTQEFVNTWSFIVDGKVYRVKNQILFYDNNTTVLLSAPQIPMKAGKQTEITIQMGDKLYTTFKFTPQRNTLAWVTAAYERESMYIKFEKLPDIKVMDRLTIYHGGRTSQIIVMTIDRHENLVYFHTTENITRGDFATVVFPEGYVDFYVSTDSTNPNFVYDKGTLIGGIPTMYIELGDNRHVDSIPHGTYVNAKYSLYSGGEYPDIVDQPLQIKGRGNYSWSVSNKKPYTLKLGEKRGLLGMGRTKRWVLINAYTDKTQIRNFLTLKAGPQIGLEETGECEFVNVVINGDYRGVYVLTQKIEIDPNVVGVDEDRGALFEIERAYRHGNHSDCIILESGLSSNPNDDVHVIIKTPELEDLSDEEKEKVLELYRIRFAILDKAIQTGYEEFSKYIDVDSFINWYILNELTKNYDSGFVTSCYMYYDPDEMKFYMGPLWDYDTCYGSQGNNNPEDFHVKDKSPWYNLMMQDKTFERKVKERFWELKNGGFFDWMSEEVYRAAIYIRDSLDLEHSRWPGEMRLTDMRGSRTIYEISGEMIALVDWMRDRVNWLSQQWII